MLFILSLMAFMLSFPRPLQLSLCYLRVTPPDIILRILSIRIALMLTRLELMHANKDAIQPKPL